MISSASVRRVVATKVLTCDDGRGSGHFDSRSALRASDVRDSAKMSPVGWEALGQWGEDVARFEPLAGGVANDVWSVRVHGHLAVGRLGARSDADLEPSSSNTSTMKV